MTHSFDQRAFYAQWWVTQMDPTKVPSWARHTLLLDLEAFWGADMVQSTRVLDGGMSKWVRELTFHLPGAFHRFFSS